MVMTSSADSVINRAQVQSLAASINFFGYFQIIKLLYHFVASSNELRRLYESWKQLTIDCMVFDIISESQARGYTKRLVVEKSNSRDSALQYP